MPTKHIKPERSIVIVRTNLYGRILSATGGGRKATPASLWFLHIVGSIIRENYK